MKTTTSVIHLTRIVFIILILFTIIACSSTVRYASNPQKKSNDTSQPSNFHTGQIITGSASYYGPKFHGRKTANGETFDMYKLSAAHKELPFETLIKVTNMKNGKSVTLKVNDRGPFVGDRILDLSYAAAVEIEMVEQGVADVTIKILRLGK